MTAHRLLVTLGDAEAMTTWSGTPFHLLAAGRKARFLHGGLRLDPNAAILRARRAVWNAAALMRTGRPGGYQYSRGFLDRVCPVALTSAGEDMEFLSHFPLLPPPARRQRVSFYIDATLKQNFEDYGLGKRIARRYQLDAMSRERDQYLGAERVVCMLSWAAASVINDYGVPRTKVFVVRAGANLDDDALAALPVAPEPGHDVLRLGFIGKDWERKGLPFLLAVAEHIESRGQPVEVVAIGPAKDRVPPHRLLRAAGFVDKERDLARFATLVRQSHFGCLFSCAEAVGISTLEFIRLGVPVLGFDVGGISESITEDVGLLFPSSTTAAKTADAVLEAWQPDRYDRLRAAARARAPEVTWTATVAALERVWGVPA